MPESKQQNERLIVMLIIGVIALNYPLLSLFSKVKLIFGIPVLYLYLFVFWIIFIVCIAVIVEKTKFQPLLTDLLNSKRVE
jgi:hypothetical protein